MSNLPPRVLRALTADQRCTECGRSSCGCKDRANEARAVEARLAKDHEADEPPVLVVGKRKGKRS